MAQSMGAELLEEMILGGDLRERSLFTERDMASKKQVSRQTIREAIIEMGAFGLIDTRPKAGNVIEHVTREDEKKVVTLRTTIEVESAIELFHAVVPLNEKEKKENLSTIKEEIDSMYKYGTQGNYIKFFQSDISFHVEIAKRSKNGFFANLIRPLYLKSFLCCESRHIFDIDASYVVKKYTEHFVSLHTDLYDALLNGDESKVRHAFCTHVNGDVPHWKREIFYNSGV